MRGQIFMPKSRKGFHHGSASERSGKDRKKCGVDKNGIELERVLHVKHARAKRKNQSAGHAYKADGGTFDTGVQEGGDGQKKRCARNHAVLKELPDGKGINQKNEDGKDSDNHESLKVGRPPGKRCRREASRFPSGRRIVALVVEDVIQDFDEVSHSTHLFEVVGGDVSVADEGAQLYEKIHCVNRVEIQVVV